MPSAMYGDYPIDQLMPLIQSGQLVLPDPQTGEPIIGFTSDGKPLTKRSAAAAAGSISSGTNLNITPNQVDSIFSPGPNGQDYGTQRPEVNAVNDRYGNDMAWLDPIFQADPTSAINTARSFGTTADPQTAAQQRALTQSIAGRGTAADAGVDAQQKGLAESLLSRGITSNPGVQNELLNLSGSIGARGNTADDSSRVGLQALAGGIGARGTAASALDEAAQRDILSGLQSRGPSAQADSRTAQQSVLDRILGMGTTADSQSEATQRGSVEELLGLYKQGGLGAQERNERATARANTEGWLRGQREADMAGLNARGLGGSGAELTSLLGDRQSAAQRLSAADLQTSADAEKRALDALLAGTGIATQMRGQADAYQGHNIDAASGLSTAVRNADDAYSNAGDNIAAQLSTAIRNAGDNFTVQNSAQQADILAGLEGRANDFTNTGAKIQSDILGGVADRNDAFTNEGSRQAAGVLQGVRTAGDAYTVNNTNSQIGLLGDQRTAADAYEQGNAETIARIQQGNVDYLRNAQQSMLNNRNAWDMNAFNQGVAVAGATQGGARADNNAGFGTQVGVATTDTGRGTQATWGQNGAVNNAYADGTAAVSQQRAGVTNTAGQTLNAAGQVVDETGKLAASVYGAGA